MNKISNVKQNDYINVSNGQYIIKDANGDIVSNNISDFNKIGIIDSNSNNNLSYVSDDIKKNDNFFKVICDSNNNSLNQDDVISAIKNGEVTSLDVTIEITHAGIPINDAYYESDSMSEDFNSLFTPYFKPLIKNHNTSTEPIGRVKNATFDKSQIIMDHDTIVATFNITDYDSMLKFTDGRYHTVSIGATSGHIKCDVCRKTILKDGVIDFCGHWRGNSYKGKRATWTMTKLDYSEVSVVNEPADKFAQVVKIQVNKGGSNTVNNSSNDSAINTIDNILNNNIDDNADNNENLDNNNKDNNENLDNNSNIKDNDDSKGNSDNNSLNIDIKDSEEYKELEAKYNEVVNENANLKTSVDSLNIDVQNKMHELNVKDNSIKELQDNLKTLALYNVSLLKDTLTLINPEIDIKTLDNKSASELNQMITSAKDNIVKNHTKVSVSNPGLCIDGKEDNEKENNFSESKNMKCGHIAANIANSWIK